MCGKKSQPPDIALDSIEFDKGFNTKAQIFCSCKTKFLGLVLFYPPSAGLYQWQIYLFCNTVYSSQCCFVQLICLFSYFLYFLPFLCNAAHTNALQCHRSYWPQFVVIFNPEMSVVKYTKYKKISEMFRRYISSSHVCFIVVVSCNVPNSILT